MEISVIMYLEVQTLRKQFALSYKVTHGFSGGASGKEAACQCRRHKRCGFDLWAGRISWRRAWQLTPGELPGESHRQRKLTGYNP